MYLIRLLFISSIVYSVEKSFVHQGVIDKLVFYLHPTSSVASSYSDGILKLIINNADCSALDSIGLKTADRHYEVVASTYNKACVLHVKPKGVGVEVGTPLDFKAINGKKGVAIEIKKGGKQVEHSFCKKPIIVLDPGHGDFDFGTIGVNGIAEKDLALQIAKKLKQELTKKGFKVILTRSTDKFVNLDMRTSLSNKYDCALFISLHANYSSNPQVHGLETYYSEMSLMGKCNNKRDLLSQKLALLVHEQLLNKLQKYKVVDRKVRKEVSQVLVGTDMPSILIELGFLSNKQEANNLIDKTYQDNITKGIAAGIEKYLMSFTS